MQMVALAQETVTEDWWNKVTFGTLRYADGCPCPGDCGWRLVDQGNLWNTKVRRWLPLPRRLGLEIGGTR